MAPRRNAKSAHRRPSSQPYRRSAPGVTRASAVLSRPLGRTVTTLHQEHGITIAGPTQGHLRLAAESQIQSGRAAPRQAPTKGTVGNTIAGRHYLELRTRIEHVSAASLWLPEIDIRSSSRDMEVVLERISGYFERWADSSFGRGSITLLDDMTVIIDRLQKISLVSEEVLNTSRIVQCLQSLEEKYLAFAALRKPYSESLLVKGLQDLQIRIRQSPTSIQERAFSTLLVRIQAVAAYPTFPSFLGNARERVSPLLDPVVVVNALRKCDELHGDFQNLTYKSESRTLWLHIWRCLKVAFVSFDVGDLSHVSDRQCLEVEFFEKPGVGREFKRLIQLPDAANPRSIENMVGKYCRFIDRCRADPDERYFHLRRLQEEPLRKHVISSLRKFAESNTLDSNTFPKLHFAVVRLNAIHGGPAIVRRWKGVEDAQEDRLTPSSYISSPAASSFSERAGRLSSAKEANVQKTTRQSTSARTNVKTHPGSTTIDAKLPAAGQHGRITAKRSFPQPRGINLTSDFDYVHCQFPETRAQEVAHSEQISRELATPGIHSEGLRPEYLINRPPAHTRDSSTLFGSQYARFFGPFGRLRAFIRRLLPGQSRPLSPISLVARKRRDKRGPDGPRAIIDPKSRVRKTTPALRLRGGGGGDPTRSHSPHREASATANVNRAPSFRAQHIATFRRMLHERHGSIASPTEDEIWNLLEQSSFRVGNAVALYNQLAPAQPSAVTENANPESEYSPQVRPESSSPEVQHIVSSPSAQRGTSKRVAGPTAHDMPRQEPPVAATASSSIPHWQGPAQMPPLQDPFYIPHWQGPSQMPPMQDPFYIPQGNHIQMPPLQEPFYLPQGYHVQLPPLQDPFYITQGQTTPHPTTSAAPPYSDGWHIAPSRQSTVHTRNPLGEVTVSPELGNDNGGGVRTAGRGLRPRPGRRPLDELVVESDENARGSAAEESSQRDSSRHDSVNNNTNQENQSPIDIHVDGPCHECPQFPGQYHHFCQCSTRPVQVHGPSDRRTTPSSIESESQEWNEREPVTDDEDEDEIDAEDDQDVQEAEHDPDTESEQDIDQRGAHRAARTLPHPNDAVPVSTLIHPKSHFRNVLSVIGSVHLPGLARMLTENTAISMRSPEARAVIRDAFNNLRRETDELRTAYRSLLDDSVPIEMDRIPRREVRRLHPAHPANRALMRRELIDIEEQYRRILKMFDAKGLRSYLNLALRQALNRFLRLMRNLRRLFLEYDYKMQRQDVGARRAATATQESETDSQSFLSDEEQDRVNKYNPRRRPSLPSKEDYGAMFRDELMREITIQRQIPEESVRTSNRNQLIDKLMELDRQGNLGAGARYGYRRMNNDAAARGRPKGWDLETAIAADIVRHRNVREGERSNERRGRRKERRQQGLSVTKHWTGHPRTNQEPFTANVRGMSSEEEFESSENDSTSTEEWP